MIAATVPLASGALAATDSGRSYFTTEAHYRAVAGRIRTALREPAGVALVAGDPAPEAEALARALSLAEPARWRVLVLAASAELSRAELRRAAGAAGEAASDAFVARLRPPPPLFVIDIAERLADRQLAELLAPAPAEEGALVLLTGAGFLPRLNAAPPPFPTERLDAVLRFQELADDEVDGFIRHQLGAAGAFPPEIVMAIAKASAGDPALVSRLAKLVLGFASSTGTMPARGVIARGAVAESPGASPAAAPAPAPPPPAAARRRRRLVHAGIAAAAVTTIAAAALTVRMLVLPPAPAVTAEALPAAEIAALLARGDAYRASGDIVSARLFYERAADAGDGRAALRLGESFDPAVLDRAGVRGVKGDAANARAWYRRAAALGDREAARRLQDITPR